MGYVEPNYTQIPNLMLDKHMMDMGEAELKVCLAIARQTFGWHKQKDKLSLTQLMKMTGLSRQGVLNGIEAGIARNVIVREAVGQSFFYNLLVNEVDRSEDVSFDTTSQRSRPELVNEVDRTSQRSRHTKETNKEKKESIPATTNDVGLASEADGYHHRTLVKAKSVPSMGKEKSKGETPSPQDAAAPPSPPAGKKKKAEAHPLTQPILNAYVEARGKNNINYEKESAWAKKIAQDGGTPEQVKGCYQWIKSDPWWEFKPVQLSKIYERLPEYEAYLTKNGLTPAGKTEAIVLNYSWDEV